MKVIDGYPPNYEEIKIIFPALPRGTAFCYGDTIYNPSGREILPDKDLHEQVHSGQQGSDPEAWWSRYLTDPEFRLSQELEAYGTQFAFVKEHIEAEADRAAKEGKRIAAGKSKLIAYGLESMADALSSNYGLSLSHGEAASKIRNCKPV